MKDLFCAAAGATPIHLVESGAGLPDALSPAHAAFAAAARFKGKAGAVLLLPDAEGAIAAVLLGAGDDGDPMVLAALPPALPGGDYALAEAPADPAASALAWALGTYRFDRYKGQPDERPAPPRLALPAGADADDTERLFAAVRRVRDLVNTPANDLGPAELEAAATELAQTYGAALTVTRGDDLLAENHPLIHAVGRASDRAPRLIDFTWGDADAPKVTLVGKGVCFDTGGLNIKTGDYMRNMKKDMGGAAHVLGLAGLIMDAGLAVRLRVLVPAVENAVGGNAYRPGDVIPSRKGLTVEIGNTDAEGRLVLADALALADEESPELLIDLATLTGAARVALGPDLPAFYCDDDAFADALATAGEATHDPVWRMPLWRKYEARIDSKVADVCHIADFRYAGSVTAALFLGRFVEHATTWVHIDTYAWTDHPRPGKTAGGEAQSMRALYAVLRARYGS